ncbi:Tissue factor pathway inhibitor 2 [Mactra antiquata]
MLGKILVVLGIISCVCLITVSGAKNADCLEPKEPGLCDAYFPRYYYDSVSNSCLEFIYGGCMGNANNFHTQSACEAHCIV